MNDPLLRVLFLLVVVCGVIGVGSALAEPVNSVNVGLGGVVQVMKHCKAYVYSIEYERLITPHITLLGRGAEVVYKFDDGEYVEQGKPAGIDVGGRYYPGGGMRGFFVGGTVGFWKADWNFTHDKDRPAVSQGNGSTDSIRTNLEIGGRFAVGSTSLSVMPMVNVGRFFPSTSCEYISPASRVGTPCDQQTEVRNYIFLELAAGVAF